jgi:hypothetical protein
VTCVVFTVTELTEYHVTQVSWDLTLCITLSGLRYFEMSWCLLLQGPRLRVQVFLLHYVPTRPPHSAHTSTPDILNTCSQLFNFNFNYQHTARCLYCGEYIYKQLHLVRMHTLLNYSVTAHPDDGQARPKHAGATN